MRSPQQPNRNGDLRTPSPRPRNQSQFHSTVSVQKNRRFSILILIFQFAAFCFSLASAIFMLSNSHGGSGPDSDSDSLRWYHFDVFRFVAIAAGIVALYSLFEIGASVWEISRGTTVFPEVVQVWFDFGHDQCIDLFHKSKLNDGGFFNAIMSFPQNYPNSPPTVKFTSEVWHPNVYSDGKVCISILHPPGDDPNGYELASERWSPVHTVESIMLSIISMLSSPNDESPANVEAAKEWRDNRDEFKKKVSRCVRRSQEMT